MRGKDAEQVGEDGVVPPASGDMAGQEQRGPRSPPLPPPRPDEDYDPSREPGSLP